MVSLYLIFYGCLELQFLDVGTNPGTWRPVPGACRILYSNVRGLSKNLSDVTVASSQYGLLLCYGLIIKTLVKLECSAPCSSSYKMKATMCQQYCKSGCVITKGTL